MAKFSNNSIVVNNVTDVDYKIIANNAINTLDGSMVYVYQDLETEQLYTLPVNRFEDGRFTIVGY